MWAGRPAGAMRCKSTARPSASGRAAPTRRPWTRSRSYDSAELGGRRIRIFGGRRDERCMKAGTNEYHGASTISGAIRRSTPFRTPSRELRTRSATTSAAARWAARIRKNKLFTFFSYEKWNNRQPYTKVLTLPTDLSARAIFPVADQGRPVRPIYDPLTSVQFGGEHVHADPFAGNVIPASPSILLTAVPERHLEPNGPGDDLSGVTTTGSLSLVHQFWNFSSHGLGTITPSGNCSPLQQSSARVSTMPIREQPCHHVR